jgi:Fe-S cluster assembly iron-binding protein IscA
LLEAATGGTGDPDAAAKPRKDSPLMLILTEEATTKLRTIMARRNIPSHGGLRLASARRGTVRFSVALVDNPAPDDEIVELDGIRVFLDTTAASVLDNRILDAKPKQGGGARFVVEARPAAATTVSTSARAEPEAHRAEPDPDPENRPADDGSNRPDFARGQHQERERVGEEPNPDFARGQRELDEPAGAERDRPDFARGQDHDDTPEHWRRGSFATGQLVGDRA